MNLQTFTTPAMLGLCALLLAMPAPANESGASNSQIDLRQLRFHPTPLPVRDAPSLASETHSRNNEVASTNTAGSLHAVPVNAVDALPFDTDADALGRYQQHITQLQDNGGLYAPGLSEAHEALGKLQLRLGDVEAALATFQAAQHVIRASNGPYSTEQIPLLREMIDANLRLGRIPDAHALQEALLSLQLRHHGNDDIAAVPALLEWADWNVRLYLSQNAQALADIDFGGTSNSRNPLLQEAYQRYIAALEILQAKETQADDSRLVDVERKLAALNFMVSRESYRSAPNKPMTMMAVTGVPANDDNALERINTFHFLNGRSALERAIAYGYVAGSPHYDTIAARLMELGDWYLLFDRRASALETYQEALALLSDAQVAPQDAERIVGSGLPVSTPDASYFDAAAPRDYAGHIDVEFDLNKYGMASNAQILDSSASDPRIERELLRTIRDGRFRPKFTNGEAVSGERVQLRYYYAVAGA
jgi:tetratricopeptide (TPR) repeat protein